MDKEDIEKIKQAGKITAQVRDYGASLIKKDASMVEVLDKEEEKIKELGGKPAFPAQISCNHLAAHYCPEEDNKTILTDQLVSLDVGVHVDGFIGDTAVTVDLSGNNEDLIKAAGEALDDALKILKKCKNKKNKKRRARNKQQKKKEKIKRLNATKFIFLNIEYK